MRDAFGGTFMIKLMLIFIAIYVTFIAVALNYAKAFRVKNKIIDIIEQNEGLNNCVDTSEGSVIDQINTYLNSISYYVSLDNKNANVIAGKNCTQYCSSRGYCIEKTENTTSKTENIISSYYTVTTYINIDFPFFGLNFNIPIRGETRKIERIQN